MREILCTCLFNVKGWSQNSQRGLIGVPPIHQAPSPSVHQTSSSLVRVGLRPASSVRENAEDLATVTAACARRRALTCSARLTHRSPRLFLDLVSSDANPGETWGPLRGFSLRRRSLLSPFRSAYSSPPPLIEKLRWVSSKRIEFDLRPIRTRHNLR
jgi:hypothetical protein